VSDFTDAPSLNHINGTQWTPDLITYDAVKLVKSTSYYVQQMFATNLGTHVLSTTPAAGASGVFWVASVNQKTKTYYLKVANTGPSSVSASISLGFTVGKTATVTSLSGSTNTSNTLYSPNNAVPKTGTIAVDKGHQIDYTFPGNAVVVFKLSKK
jgi:alpha-N-arabinofuranosidase